jgi:hypothetical protein
MRHPKLLAAALLCAAFAMPANATTLVFSATLSGLNESPVNASPGSGSATITVDDIARTMRIQADFQNLLGNTTASHIHCCTAVADTGNAGVATATPTFPGFPLGVTAGSYDSIFDMTLASSYNAAFLNSLINGGSTSVAFATLLSGLNAGTSYFNVHTNLYPAGEVRGFIHAVPEPGTWALMCLGVMGLALTRTRRSMI